MIIEVTLIRHKMTEEGTQGCMLMSTDSSPEIEYLCDTLELPWRDNQRNISCIPAGSYKVTKREPSQKFNYPHFILHDVQERSWILIHIGNMVQETAGCILVGERRDTNDFIFNSRLTLRELHDTLPEQFTLTIKEQPDD